MSSKLILRADDTDWRIPRIGPGLLLDVPAVAPWRGRPFLHLQAAPPFVRLMAGEQPVSRIHIEEEWVSCGFLRGPARQMGVIPPISAADVRAIHEEPRSAGWWEAWMRYIVRQLETSPESPLHAGRWCLRPMAEARTASSAYSPRPQRWHGVPPEPPQELTTALHFDPFWREHWQWDGYYRDHAAGEERIPRVASRGEVHALRAPSDESSGRMKAWRKAARDGTLPPVLLLYLAFAGKWVLLDGHDRMRAASFEQLPTPVLGLWLVAEEPIAQEAREHARVRAHRIVEGCLRGDVALEELDEVNRFVVQGYTDVHRSAASRAWPLPGGAQAWRAEALAWREARKLPVDERDWQRFMAPGWW